MNEISKINYDIEERTARFGEDVIEFCKEVNQDTITKPIISQLIRSGTSSSIFKIRKFLIDSKFIIHNS